MAKITRRLGRGLGSLISSASVPINESVPFMQGGGRSGRTIPADPSLERTTEPPDSEMSEVPIDAVAPNPFQPRSTPSESDVLSLAESIRTNGMIQPIVVRRHGRGYQIVTGERRWWASRHLKRDTIPVIIRQASDEQMLELALVENIQREDLNAIDRAQAYRQYCTHFGATPEQVATRMGEDRTTVVNYLRLLDLDDSIQSQVASGALSMGHARCLLGVADPARRRELAAAISSHQLSVRAVEEIVRREKSRDAGDGTSGPGAEPSGKPPHLTEMESRFEDALKTKVYIKESRRRHHGRIVIEYYSLDDFDRIASALGVEME